MQDCMLEHSLNLSDEISESLVIQSNNSTATHSLLFLLLEIVLYYFLQWPIVLDYILVKIVHMCIDWPCYSFVDGLS